MNTITLEGVLPRVFATMMDSGDESAIGRSDIWLRTLTVTRGERLLVKARSGAGKSSLCAYLYGRRNDYDGRILIDGSDLRSLGHERIADMRRTSMAYLPQDILLFPELTALENVAIKNNLTHYLNDERIRQMFEALEIDHRMDWPVARLSIGQQQRVAAIRALAQPFDVILLDEPVSHLDSEGAQALATLVSDEASQRSATVIVTSVGYDLPLDYTSTLML